MKLRDLNHWDFFKLIFVVEYLLGLLFAPLVIIIALLFSEPVPTISGAYDQVVAIGLGIKASGKNIAMIISMSLLITIVISMIKAVMLTYLCKFTRFGNIKIGNMRPRKNAISF